MVDARGQRGKGSVYGEEGEEEHLKSSIKGSTVKNPDKVGVARLRYLCGVVISERGVCVTCVIGQEGVTVR